MYRNYDGTELPVGYTVAIVIGSLVALAFQIWCWVSVVRALRKRSEPAVVAPPTVVYVQGPPPAGGQYVQHSPHQAGCAGRYVSQPPPRYDMQQAGTAAPAMPPPNLQPMAPPTQYYSAAHFPSDPNLNGYKRG